MFKKLILEEKEVFITKKQLENKIRENEQMQKKISLLLEEAPEGSVTCQIRNGKLYYYHQIKNPNTGEWKKIYIKKTNQELAKQLVEKEYLEKAKAVLDEQERILRIFQENYNEKALEQYYESLPKERKQLVEPLTDSVSRKMKEWLEETYEVYDAYPENKKYETDRGEMVRSKSEVIIANLLYQHKQMIDYKYERPLKLYTKDKKEILIHPDFTIINKETGKIYYYEHAGKMDEPYYANEFVKKINTYIENDLLPGRDVIVTYETLAMPLNIKTVKCWLKDIVYNR